MSHVVVVGGGPAGLAAAYRLIGDTGHTVHVVERAPRLGGLAAGFEHGDYTLDFGPHRLHQGTDPRVLDDLRRLLGADLQRNRRRGRIRLRGRYLSYPVGPATLPQLGLPTLLAVARGALRAQRTRAPVARSYAEAISARLGQPLYDLFYGPYAEKVWGQPGSLLSAEQAERRVNQRGPLDLLRLALGQSPSRFFFYPRRGFGQIPAAYGAMLASRSAARVDCDVRVERVSWRDGRVLRVETSAGGFEPEHLIWTAPLPELVRQIDPPPPNEVTAASARLRSRAVVLCYVALARPRVGQADTYYFPERRFPFNRVIEQKNFSVLMAPPERTVLGLDLACQVDDAVWHASDTELRALVVPALEEAGLVRGDEVLEVFSRRFRSAYPIYDVGAADHLLTTQRWLAQIENLWLIGRQGLYLHNNTHHSLRMGYTAAEAITSREGRLDWPAALAEFARFTVAD